MGYPSFRLYAASLIQICLRDHTRRVLLNYLITDRTKDSCRVCSPKWVRSRPAEENLCWQCLFRFPGRKIVVGTHRAATELHFGARAGSHLAKSAGPLSRYP